MEISNDVPFSLSDSLLIMKVFSFEICTTHFAVFFYLVRHMSAGSTIFINMAGNYHIGYLPEGQTWFSGDNVVGGKNLFVCVGLWLILSSHKGHSIW